MPAPLNPEVYETIAKQMEAEADAHEAEARELRRQAMLERGAGKYAKILQEKPR